MPGMYNMGQQVPMSAGGVPMGSGQPFNPPSASPEQRLAAVAEMLPGDLLGMLMRMIQSGAKQPPMPPQPPMGIPGINGGMPTMGPAPMPMPMPMNAAGPRG